MAELWPFIQSLVKKWQLEEESLPLNTQFSLQSWSVTFNSGII